MSFMICYLTFFVVFFRLSIVYPYLYLSIIPALAGGILLCSSIFLSDCRTRMRLNREQVYLGFIFLSLTIFSSILDLFNQDLSLYSSFLFRFLLLFSFSILPAYFLASKLKDGRVDLTKIVSIAFWVQIVIFFVMYFSSDAKQILYSIFGLGDSVNLNEQNMRARGFGLSAEINFMTPSLMIVISFLLLDKSKYLRVFCALTQIVNSNMAVVAFLISIVFSNVKFLTKIIVGILLSLCVVLAGHIIFPRFFDEFISGGGLRTINYLLDKHLFAVGSVNIINFLFGFQVNISSTIPDLRVFSDMGWTIMFNYGGFVFVFLFFVFLALLSICAFGKSKIALVWFLIGVIFNTKGFLLGMNGYMFISFIYVFMKNDCVKIPQ